MTVSTHPPADQRTSVIGQPGAHHDGSELYVGTAKPAPGDDVPIRTRVPQDTGVGTVRVRMIRDGEPTYVQAKSDGVTDGEEWFVADVTMHNPVNSYRIQLDRG